MRSTSSGVSRSVASGVSRSAAGVYAGLATQVVAMTALVVFEETRGRGLAARIATFGGDPDAPGAHQVMGAVSIFAILIIAALTATALAVAAYLTWLRRVQPHTPALALTAAVLLPGVNLVMPPILADLAWRKAVRHNGPEFASAHGARRPRWLMLVGCWWLSWLAALGLVFARPTQPGRDLTGVDLPALAAIVVAAILCAATVREISRLHEEDGEGGRPQAPRSRQRGAAPHRERLTRESPERPRGPRPLAHRFGYHRRTLRDGHRVGPELPELACQSRRWGSAGWRTDRPARTPGAGPISE